MSAHGLTLLLFTVVSFCPLKAVYDIILFDAEMNRLNLEIVGC